MRNSMKAALLALALAAGAAGTGTAMADSVTVGVSPGGFAFGYSDGYWDTGHHWHAWRDAREEAEFHHRYADHFYDWKHDRDHDEGWRDSDHWWAHR